MEPCRLHYWSQEVKKSERCALSLKEEAGERANDLQHAEGSYKMLKEEHEKIKSDVLALKKERKEVLSGNEQLQAELAKKKKVRLGLIDDIETYTQRQKSLSKKLEIEEQIASTELEKLKKSLAEKERKLAMTEADLQVKTKSLAQIEGSLESKAS